ncbi:MAG: insulinase family protein [Gammaproteobacteria bacterium]|nr:insulinase family protein [Gammaproteobacteria bacterium]
MSATKQLLTLCAALLLSSPAAAGPAIQQWQTGNGAQVYFVAAPELPMVDIQVTFNAGSARDGASPGLALFTNAMLEEGAGDLDANAIAEQFDRLGANASFGSLRDMATASLRSLTEERLLAPAVQTFAQLLREPSFPAAALERVRKQMVVGLRHESQSPASIASNAFYEALYADHPYATPPSGTLPSVLALGRDELTTFHRRYYVGRNAVVAIVGAVDRQQAQALAEQVVASLPAGEAAAPLPPVAPLSTASRQHIAHQSTQTHLLLGQPGMRRGDPDYFALYLGNHILGGGGLVSRISDEIREKRGLSYSAYSAFSPMAAEGPYLLSLQTKNDSREEALEVLRTTLAQFIAEGPSAAELTAAKKNITGGFALNIDSNKDILSYIAMIGFYGLPLDYLDTFIGQVNAVSTTQIRDAFQRRIHPERMALITVGEQG